MTRDKEKKLLPRIMRTEPLFRSYCDMATITSCHRDNFEIILLKRSFLPKSLKESEEVTTDDLTGEKQTSVSLSGEQTLEIIADLTMSRDAIMQLITGFIGISKKDPNFNVNSLLKIINREAEG